MGVRVTCKHCGGAHPAFDCKKSTAAQKVVPQARQEAGSCASTERRGGVISEMRQEVAGTQALPVDTNSEHRENGGFGAFTSKNVSATTSAGTVGNEDRQPIPKRKRGRPRTITDMRSYKAAKQREYRERKKSEHQ